MAGILIKRYREISKRMNSKVTMRWFSPLDKHEMEKLGIDPNKKEKQIL